MKTVVLYETAPDTTMEKMMEIFPAHQANEEIFVKAGKILGIGPFAIPGEGAMAIFTDRESAEEFVKGDPFVTTGLVSKVIIKEWHDELVFEAPENEVEIAKKLIKENMENAYKTEVPLLVEVGVGENWLEAH